MKATGSAAGGGCSDLSEWQRSADDAGVRAKEDAGHRNRNCSSGGGLCYNNTKVQ